MCSLKCNGISSLDFKFQSKSVNLATNFSERKAIDFCCVQMIYTPFDS